MFKKIMIIWVAVFLITLNAQAGSDGELTLKKNEPKEVKDCFENLNSTPLSSFLLYSLHLFNNSSVTSIASNPKTN